MSFGFWGVGLFLDSFPLILGHLLGKDSSSLSAFCRRPRCLRRCAWAGLGLRRTLGLRGVNCGRSGCFIGRFSRASHNIKKHLLKVLVIPPVICCSSSSPRQPGPPHPSAFLTDVIITGRIDWEVWTAGCQRLVTFHAGRVLDVYTSQRVVWNASAQVAIRDSTLGKATVLLAAHLNLHGYSETAMLTENFYLVCWVSFEVQAVLFSGLPPQPLERF